MKCFHKHFQSTLASACKTKRLNEARAALAMPTLNPAAVESAAGFMRRVAGMEVLRCPCCAQGRLRVVQTRRGMTRLPVPGAAQPWVACRGPP